MSLSTTYFVPVADGNRIGIDFGDLYSDCFPERKTSTVTFEMVQRKTDSLPEVGSRITYENEQFFVRSVVSHQRFWTCRKKWTRTTAMLVRNPYRRITVNAE
jgi:hypothetical protein